MNPRRQIGLELLVMLAVTVYDEVKRKGRKMPLPSAIAAVAVFYSILGIVAEFRPAAGRVAAGVGGLVILASLLSGLAGKSIVDALRWATRKVGGHPSQLNAPPTTPTESTLPIVGPFRQFDVLPAPLRPARP